MKLTKAQYLALVDASEGDGLTCSPYYKPAMKLAEAGYVTGETSRYGSYRIIATPAGREALAQETKE